MEKSERLFTVQIRTCTGILKFNRDDCWSSLVIQLEQEPQQVGEFATYGNSRWYPMGMAIIKDLGIDPIISKGIEEVVEKNSLKSAMYRVVEDTIGNEKIWWISISFKIDIDDYPYFKDRREKSRYFTYHASPNEVLKRHLQEAIDRQV